ncbi:CgeB family protein [Paenibacillus whitsoniae]|nr:glycosyltransferase [Paenibacillus whitsoniae]
MRVQKSHQRAGIIHAKRQGQQDGYHAGLMNGIRMGRCEAVLQQAARDRAPNPFWNARVLYVTSGKSYPYEPIDLAVINSLRPLVQELIIGNTEGDRSRIGQPNASVEALAARHRPDMMLVLDGVNLGLDVVQRLRHMGIRTAVWLTDDPYYTDITAAFGRYYDFIFTMEINCVQFYRDMGCPQVHYVPLAFQPEMFRPKPVSTSVMRDICFIGSAYWNRVVWFDKLAPFLASKRVLISGIWWDRLRQYRLLAPQIQLGTWMPPDQTADFYNGAKIVINMHRASDDESYNNNSRRIAGASPNPRTFEISGCGVLQLTDVRSDLASFYTPGYDIETYASPEELMHKLNHYLQHEEERNRIALRGLYRTMRDHTYANRLVSILSIVFGPR